MIHVVTGPPCAGKTTYIKENASAGDLIIDFDALAVAFGAEPYEADGIVLDASLKARAEAIKVAKENQDADSWIIDTNHREKFAEHEDLIELDPGKEVCLERAKQDGRPQRTLDGIEAWYSGRKGHKMEHLYKSFDIKSDEGSGKISGYFSTYDRIPDSYGDVIAPGAFTDTIKAREDSGHPFPLCWNHDLDQIIGKVDSIEDTEKGPLMTASFFDTPLAQEKRAIVQSGVVYQFSFAYSIEDAKQVTLEDGTKANELRKLDLYEVSIVPIPANPRAEVTDIKADEAEAKDAEPEVKAGARNSKKDADAIREAISLLQGVLGELDDIEADPEDGEDEVKANEASEEPEQSNPRKDALLDVIAKFREEEV